MLQFPSLLSFFLFPPSLFCWYFEIHLTLFLLKGCYGLLPLEITYFCVWFTHQAFDQWNKTELDSFLIEITANILKFKDADGTHLLPKIRDSAGQKGTGKWTAISALEYGTPVTLIGKMNSCVIYPRYECVLLLFTYRGRERHLAL